MNHKCAGHICDNPSSGGIVTNWMQTWHACHKSCHKRWSSCHKLGPYFRWPCRPQFGVLMMRALMIMSPTKISDVLYCYLVILSHHLQNWCFIFLTTTTTFCRNFLLHGIVYYEELDCSIIPWSVLYMMQNGTLFVYFFISGMGNNQLVAMHVFSVLFFKLL